MTGRAMRLPHKHEPGLWFVILMTVIMGSTFAAVILFLSAK
jgi:hypothetical protein